MFDKYNMVRLLTIFDLRITRIICSIRVYCPFSMDLNLCLNINWRLQNMFLVRSYNLYSCFVKISYVSLSFRGTNSMNMYVGMLVYIWMYASIISLFRHNIFFSPDRTVLSDFILIFIFRIDDYRILPLIVRNA